MRPKIYALYLRQDDPRKNTIVRLARLGLVEILAPGERVPRGALVLDPFAEMVISPADREIAENRGILVIDCSWSRVIETFRKLDRVLRKCTRRRLPFLVSANPSHYGKPYMLTSAESLAAALYIIGYKDMSSKILSSFKWGQEFIRINYERLERYSKGEIDFEKQYFEYNRENVIKLLREFHDIK